jgi:hypothetical protein
MRQSRRGRCSCWLLSVEEVGHELDDTWDTGRVTEVDIVDVGLVDL